MLTGCLPRPEDSRENSLQQELTQMTDSIAAPGLARPPRQGAETQAKLHQLAQDLEATFLAEMLDYAGLGETSQSFGGGIGERQFASFLRQEQAAAMVKAGGIGLAESLFRAMTGERA
jgi:Rod binding domain-containing protein